MAGVLGRALSRGVLADVRPAGVLSGYDPFGAAALSGYGIDPFEVQQRNLVDDTNYRFQPQGQMARLGQIASDAAQGSRDTRAALDAKWALMGYPDSMRRQIDRAGNPNNIGRFARDQYEGFVSDVQSAGDWNERGDNNWVSDLGDYGMLAMGFIPGVRSTRGKIHGWHGSPHTFAPEPGHPLGRFDLSRVGTGEGTQMEGHGLYIGEAKGTGQFYRESTVKDAMARAANQSPSGPIHPQQQRQIVEQILDIVKREGVDALDEYAPPRGFEGPWNAVASFVRERGGVKGRLYEVEIDAQPEDFIDLDRTVGEQSPAVLDALNRVARDPAVDWSNAGITNITNDMRTRQLRGILRNPDAVQRLAEHGVAGSRYYDAGSLTGGIAGDPAKLGNLTRNYVVYDPALISILRRYAIPGVLGGSVLGAGVLSQPQQAQAAQ